MISLPSDCFAHFPHSSAHSSSHFPFPPLSASEHYKAVWEAGFGTEATCTSGKQHFFLFSEFGTVSLKERIMSETITLTQVVYQASQEGVFREDSGTQKGHSEMKNARRVSLKYG